MISTNSLQAFSGATTTSPLNRASGADPIRLVREKAGASDRQAAGKPNIPESRPTIPPPRGSLLNLSV